MNKDTGTEMQGITVEELAQRIDFIRHECAAEEFVVPETRCMSDLKLLVRCKTAFDAQAATITEQNREIERLRLSRNAWEDSARIAVARAEAAELSLKAAMGEKGALEKKLAGFDQMGWVCDGKDCPLSPCQFTMVIERERTRADAAEALVDSWKGTAAAEAQGFNDERAALEAMGRERDALRKAIRPLTLHAIYARDHFTAHELKNHIDPETHGVAHGITLADCFRAEKALGGRLVIPKDEA